MHGLTLINALLGCLGWRTRHKPDAPPDATAK
jgi:hypothetical protein